MSRPYRIVIQKVIEHEVSAADRSTLRLALDDLVPGPRLAELLREALERNGWTEVEPGVFEKERGDGETMSCDVSEREVTTVIELERTVSETLRRELRGDTWNWVAGREMTAAELEEVQRRAADALVASGTDERQNEAAEELRREATARLEAGDAERRREVNRLVLEVTAAALKEKARELGSVEQVDEAWHGDEYELTIAVRE